MKTSKNGRFEGFTEYNPEKQKKYIEIVNYIINNGSVDEPVTNAEISAFFHTKEVSVRKLINQARCDGVPVCSCSKGYYYSTERTDIVETVRSLTNRTIAVERAVNGLLSSLIEIERDNNANNRV